MMLGDKGEQSCVSSKIKLHLFEILKFCLLRRVHNVAQRLPNIETLGNLLELQISGLYPTWSKPEALGLAKLQVLSTRLTGTGDTAWKLRKCAPAQGLSSIPSIHIR